MPIQKYEFERAKVDETIFITDNSSVWRVVGKWTRDGRYYLLLDCDGVLLTELFYYQDGQYYSGCDNTVLSAPLNEPEARVGGISRREFLSVVPGRAVFVDCNGEEWKIVERIARTILSLKKDGEEIWVTISISGNRILHDKNFEPVAELNSMLAWVKYEDDPDSEHQPRPRLQ